jgi:hypothetical protein
MVSFSGFPLTTQSQLAECIALTRARVADGHLAVGPVVEVLGRTGLTMACLVKCLPFLQPIPLGPLATLAGGAFFFVGLQLVRGNTPKLPQKVQDYELNPKIWERVFGTLERVERWAGVLSRPRLEALAQSGRVRGLLIALAGVLMALPLPMIPASNSLPALVVLTAALAEMKRDGLMVVLSLFFFVLTLAYFGFVTWGMIWMGDEFWQWLQGFFG